MRCRPWLLTCLYKLILFVRRALRLSHHHSSRLATTVILSCICTYLELSASGVLAVHITINALGLKPWFPMSILVYIHEPLHGFAYAHYWTHSSTARGAGFRNESFPQVENLPQLFHPHTYVTPTPIHNMASTLLFLVTPQTPSNPWYYHILTTFLPTYAYSPTHTHII